MLTTISPLPFSLPFLLLFVLLLVSPSFSTAARTDEFYYENWCGHPPLYLHDEKCLKVFPSKVDRDFSCPLPAYNPDELGPGWVKDAPLSSALRSHIDTSTLQKYVSSTSVHACIILTRRVKIPSPSILTNGNLTRYNRFLCLGEKSVTDAFQTWSSSKVFAMAFAAGALRSDPPRSSVSSIGTHMAGVCDSGSLGLDAFTQGKNGVTPLGDLATIITTYDTTKKYTSNSLSRYFNTIGRRAREHSLVTLWLGNVSTSSQPVDVQSLGGDYGEPAPSDLSYTLSSHSSPSKFECPVPHDTEKEIFPNMLSSLSHAELVRRIALHREIPTALRFPDAEWADMQEILYGAAPSLFFPGLQFGGMTADIGIFLQAAINITEVQKISNGNWRIASKLGAGYSNERNRGEIVTDGYACLPGFGNPGYEFTFSVQSSVVGDSNLKQSDSNVEKTMREIMEALQSGYLD